MAKKEEKEQVSSDYLGNRLKELVDQKKRVEELLEKYSEVWTKLSGAIEITESMIEDLSKNTNNHE